MRYLRVLLFLFPALILATIVLATTKPVDVRDFNGTYTGAVGTGSYDYVTLYRDNYGQDESGCEGEGCGSHAGVDIRVPSGTPVYASRTGYVVASGCDWNGIRYQTDSMNSRGFGNYIVLEVQDPQAGTIYLVYAHLSARFWGVNNIPVPEGEVIGLSGGSEVDPCPGRAQAAHLHFQIDKSFPSPVGGTVLPFNPRYLSRPGVPQANCTYIPGGAVDPDCRTPNTPDSDFRLMTYTYNPIPLVTAGYNWTFDWSGNTDGNREFWVAVNTATPGQTAGGRFAFDPQQDPWIWRNPNARLASDSGRAVGATGGIAIEASIYNYVVIDIDNTTCISNPGKVYFITNWSPTWCETSTCGPKVRTFNYSGPGTYYINMAGTNWSGYVTGLRIDPAVNCSIYYDPTHINQIRVMR